MRQSYLVYCECGTPLLREVRWHLPAKEWANAYESGNPNATIKMERIYQHYRWHLELLRESGTYDVPENERIECCSACARVLETKGE